MKKLYSCILIIFLAAQVYSIEIRLLDQSKISGKILAHTKKIYYIGHIETLYLIHENAIDKFTEVSDNEFSIISEVNYETSIDFKLYNNVIEIDKNHFKKNSLTEGGVIEYQRKNITLLPAAIAMLALSYDYLDNASKLNKNLKDLDQESDLYNSLKDEISKQNTLGYIFLGTGIITSFIAFHKVRVYTNYNAIGLSYNF